MMESAGPPDASPRAFLHVGASTLAHHQLALAIALDCQRVVCIARGLVADLVELQHEAERAGAQFHVITSALALTGLVTANDEVLVLADGLLLAPQSAMPLLDGGHCVLVQPIEVGLEGGFERLDLNHASAGAMRVPGRLVERLAELPPDCDLVSALTRIALQAGVAQRMVPQPAREGARWRLIRTEDEAHAVEAAWIDLHVSGENVRTPGPWLARLLVRGFGPALLHAGSGGNALAAVAIGLILMALGAGWFGFVATGLALCTFAWLVRQTAALLLQVVRDSLSRSSRQSVREEVFGWGFDAALVALLTWGIASQPWLAWHERMFVPLMLICLLRLLPRALPFRWTIWLDDRLVLGLLLFGGAIAGYISYLVYFLAGFLAVAGIVLPSGRARSG
jgi:hypothetical protein